MDYLYFTKKRLTAFIEEIESLQEIEFPYDDPKNALQILNKYFRQELDKIAHLGAQHNQEAVRQKCRQLLSITIKFLPLLGFILRSTNVRNAFEIFRPLYRLAGDLLEPKKSKKSRRTQLLLSSEWMYSPHIYNDIVGLEDFIFIGFPAPESSNPLLIPLAGHELGHPLWRRENLVGEYTPKLQFSILNSIKKDWVKLQQQLPRLANVTLEEFISSLLVFEIVGNAPNWAAKQLEEIFCDFVGLYLFGTSYLLAFAYLLSPYSTGYRTVYYPHIETRVMYLLKAADTFKISIPENYTALFKNNGEPLLSVEDKFKLDLADSAVASMVDELIASVVKLIKPRVKLSPSENGKRRVLERFSKVVPCGDSDCLADILNAAWEAYLDDKFWEKNKQVADNRDRILKDLTIKNIELFDINFVKNEALI